MTTDPENLRVDGARAATGANEPANKAIVFNCGYNGLSIIQDLGRRGVQCLAMDSVRSIGTYSRYAEYVACPDPAYDESGFVEFLFDYCARLAHKPVLFPTNDHWAMAVARHRQSLLEVSLPCVADWSSIRQVIEKDHFYRIGEERGYGTPATVERSELAFTSPDMFPLAAKPKHRRVSADAKDDGFHRAMDRLRLVVMEDRDALDEFLLEEEPWIPDLVFQSYVPGLSDMMRTVGVYADREHAVRAIFTGRKLRGYPADAGDCVVGENFTMPYPVVNEVHRIVADLRLSGILEFEFKYDEIRDTHVLIEVNPRSWSWVGITSAMGAGLPWTAYADLTGRNEPTATAQSKTVPDGSVRYARVIDDAINTLFRYGSRHPWSKGILRWWSDLNAAPLVRYAEFQRDDPVVALVSLLRGMRTLGAWLMAAARRTAGDAVRAASGGSTPAGGVAN